MGTVSLLNLGFFAKLATIVDIIPKIIYLLYACLASAVDALQALVRKLAGLDVYYQATTGEAVSGTDPLTEFVYGILGFGNSAPLYEALNTVFWSFAIFGLIILAVSTMAAIIKSHYKEDSQGTSPWKYIYTAGKAIFTFAVVPVLVIIGLQLSSFVLRTLDNITAGAGSEQEMIAMFGSDVVHNRFKSETVEGTAEYDEEGNRIEGSGTITYAYYDFFGSGAPSTTTTFSGMLFKAAAYSCNRVRTGSYKLTQLQDDFFGGGLLGNEDSDFPDSGSEDEQFKYIADQIDYLFSNNVHLASDYSYWQVVSESNDVAPVWSLTDITGGVFKTVVGSFSKFDVSFVWIFYALWNFNYITGFVGVFVTFGIMISIILGMMSRLIKGAALFLIYPALLGIAPLDDFKAFKSWGVQFMQQLMMAFGSILGINLLLLILPYVQNINFFDIGIVDAMIQLIMLVAGLLMAKDFISMINSFVGGADASQAGEGAKGSIGGKLKAGIKPAAAIAGGVARTGVKIGTGAVKTVGKSIAVATSKARANKAKIKAENRKENVKNARQQKNAALDNIVSSGKLGEDANNKIKAAREKAEDDARKSGKSGDEVKKAGEEAATALGRKLAAEFAHSKEGKKTTEAKQYNASNKSLLKSEVKYDKAANKENKIATKYHLKQDEEGYYQKTGKTYKQQVGAAFSGLADVGKTMADSFIKTLKSVSNPLGLDKAIAGAKEVLGESLTFKGGVFEEHEKKRKENKDKDAAVAKDMTAAQNSQAQTDNLSDIASSMKELIKTTQTSQQATTAALKDLKLTFKSTSKKDSSSTTSSSGGSSGGSSDSSSSGGSGS